MNARIAWTAQSLVAQTEPISWGGGLAAAKAMVAFAHEPTLVAALATGALAGVVIVLRPGAVTHRALALLLLFYSLSLGLLAFSTGVTGRVDRLLVYPVLALPFAALNFAYLVWQEYGQGRPHGRWTRGLVRTGILAAALVVEGLYLVDHALYAGVDARGFAVVGPLDVVRAAFPLTLAVVAALLASAHRASDAGPRRSALWLVTIAFAVIPAFRATFWIAGDVVLMLYGRYGGQLWLETAMNGVALVVLGWTLVLLRTSRDGTAPAWTHALAVVGAAAAAAVVVRLWPFTPWPALSFRVLFVANASWALLFVGLSVFALLRYEYFGIELRLKVALRHSTLVALIAFLFLVTTEVLERLLPARDQTIALVAAVGLAFVARALQRLVERFIERLMPHVKRDDAYMVKRRRDIYRAAVEGAVRDGEIVPREAKLLEVIRAKLELPPDEARAIEEGAGASLAMYLDETPRRPVDDPAYA